MAESVSLYVTENTRESIEQEAEKRYGTTTQKSAIVVEAIRASMYYAPEHDVDVETPIISIAKQVPADDLSYDTELMTEISDEVDADDKTTIRVSLPSQLLDYLDAHEPGRGRIVDPVMSTYDRLLYVYDSDDDEEDQKEWDDVHEYLLKTDTSELSAQGIDAHELKESAKYRIPYLIAKLNDKYATEFDVDRHDIDNLISETYTTVSEPTREKYRKTVYNALADYTVDIDGDNFVADNIYSRKGRKAPASSGLDKRRSAQVLNLAEELADADEDNIDDVIQRYVDKYINIEYQLNNVVDDVIDVLQLYKSDNDIEVSAIDDRIDTVISELESL